MSDKNAKAFAVEISANGKTGPVSATYASQDTCPPACPLLKKGCYAKTGHVGIVTKRLNTAPSMAKNAMAEQEAQAISELTGRQDLRVHVVGDCTTGKTARIIAGAMKKHRKRRGRSAWTYTHSWKRIPVKNWLGESVLASCETISKAKEAMFLGYAPAVIVESFDRPGPYVKDGLKILPCRHTTHGVQCVDCRACFDVSALLRTKTAIGFIPHGSESKAVIRVVHTLTIKPKRALICS